jgi:hypothetical protein
MMQHTVSIFVRAVSRPAQSARKHRLYNKKKPLPGGSGFSDRTWWVTKESNLEPPD